MKSVSDILKEALGRKQKLSPDYSRRALARDLGVSPAFVSSMFNGKKIPPKDRIDDLVRLLELDLHTKNQLVKSILVEHNHNDSVKEFVLDAHKKELKMSTINRKRGENVLSQWWYLPTLEALTLADSDKESIKNRLGITEGQWNDAIHVLLNEELIEKKDDHFKKTAERLYMPIAKSKVDVRKFHFQMIEKSLTELENNDELDVERRFITGTTFTLSHKHLNMLKAKIIEFLDDITLVATVDKGDEVYQFNIQFFPLTKKIQDS